jgi:hypothetical protein
MSHTSTRADGGRPAARRPAAGRTFYVSAAGTADDGNDGRTPAAAWRTIARANAAGLRAGDALLFRGGDAFRGNLRLGRANAGTARRPVVIGSFGRGRATILAGGGDGVAVRNAGGVRVHDLVFRGAGWGKDAGPARNSGSGIAFENALPGDVKLAHVRVDRVEVSGFGRFGITVGGRRGKSGFRDVRITRADVHGNRDGGIETHGRFSPRAVGYANEDVYVGRCDAHDNPGYARSCRHVGDGIVLSDVDRATVERCRAWGNGGRCTCRDGPVGIWAWDANAVTIQHCESHHNRTAGPADGGGFDLDGGVTNSVLQHNYSHDNDGAGFGVYQFRGARPMRANVVRHNVSVNDGRRNGYGAIQLMNCGSGVRNVEIHDNVVRVGPVLGGPPGSLPSAVRLKSATAGVRVRGNLLVVSGGVPLVRVRGRQDGLTFHDNLFRAADGRLCFWQAGRVYRSVEAWGRALSQGGGGCRWT